MSVDPGEDLEFMKREFEEFIKGLICLPIKFPGTRLYKSLKVIGFSSIHLLSGYHFPWGFLEVVLFFLLFVVGQRKVSKNGGKDSEGEKIGHGENRRKQCGQ